MRDDVFAYDKWKSMAEQIAPRNGMPVPSSVHIAELEQEIEKWIR